MKQGNERWRQALDRWIWLCPPAMVLAAAGVLAVWGWSWGSAFIVALLLACPVLLIWGAIKVWRKRRDGRSW